jgi:hypothetical protein
VIIDILIILKAFRRFFESHQNSQEIEDLFSSSKRNCIDLNKTAVKQADLNRSTVLTSTIESLVPLALVLVVHTINNKNWVASLFFIFLSIFSLYKSRQAKQKIVAKEDLDALMPERQREPFVQLLQACLHVRSNALPIDLIATKQEILALKFKTTEAVDNFAALLRKYNFDCLNDGKLLFILKHPKLNNLEVELLQEHIKDLVRGAHKGHKKKQRAHTTRAPVHQKNKETLHQHPQVLPQTPIQRLVSLLSKSRKRRKFTVTAKTKEEKNLPTPSWHIGNRRYKYDKKAVIQLHAPERNHQFYACIDLKSDEHFPSEEAFHSIFIDKVLSIVPRTNQQGIKKFEANEKPTTATANDHLYKVKLTGGENGGNRLIGTRFTNADGKQLIIFTHNCNHKNFKNKAKAALDYARRLTEDNTPHIGVGAGAGLGAGC